MSSFKALKTIKECSPLTSLRCGVICIGVNPFLTQNLRSSGETPNPDPAQS